MSPHKGKAEVHKTYLDSEFAFLKVKNFLILTSRRFPLSLTLISFCGSQAHLPTPPGLVRASRNSPPPARHYSTPQSISGTDVWCAWRAAYVRKQSVSSPASGPPAQTRGSNLPHPLDSRRHGL